VTSNCSFPFTYNGQLYYSCTDNIANVSPDDEKTVCLDNNATAILCDIPLGLFRPKVIYFIPVNILIFPSLAYMFAWMYVLLAFIAILKDSWRLIISVSTKTYRNIKNKKTLTK